MNKRKINVLKSSIFVFALFIMGIFIIKGINGSFAASTSLPDTMTAYGVDEDDPSLVRTTGLASLATSMKYLKDGDDVYVVYCLDKNKGWPVNSANFDYNKSSVTVDYGYSYIMLNGYHNLSGDEYDAPFTGDDYTDNYITQLAVWLYQDMYVDNTVLSDEEVASIENYTYYDYVESLVDGASAARTAGGITPNPSISISSSDFTYNLSKDSYVSDLISVSSDVAFESYTVSFTGVSDYKLYDGDGKSICSMTNGTPDGTCTIDYNRNFFIEIPGNATISSSTIGLNLVVKYTEYLSYQYDPSSHADDEQRVGLSVLTTEEKTKNFSTSFTLPTGSLTVVKEDTSHNKIADAKILITGPNNYSRTITSSTTATTISGLLPGTYTLEEITPPRGFVVTDSKSVNVNVNDTTTATLTDDEIEVDIEKVNSSGNRVAGAVIEVRNKQTNELYISFTTGATKAQDVYTKNDKLVSGDTYVAKEVRAPDGYILNSTPYEFTVTKNNYHIKIPIVNDKNSVEIIKLDDNNNCFSGAVLGLYKEDNTFVQSWETQCNGTVAVPKKLTGLANGNYYVKEVSVPDGYVLSTSKQTFTVSNTGVSPSTVTFTNTKRSVILKKLDKDSGLPIAGASLRVYNNSNSVSRDYNNIPETGVAIDDLPVGTYHVIETKAPDGYIKSNEIVDFEITASTTNKTVTFSDTKNKITIAKVDENGNYVSGAILKLYNSSRNQVARWQTTTEPYEISGLNIKHGTYYLVEEKAPDGYIYDDTEYTITIDENSDNDNVFQFVNKKFNIQIDKKDENNNYLEGVTLALYDSNNNQIGSWVTRGEAYKPSSLAYGSYCVKELATLDGYILDKESHCFTISEGNETQTIKIVNKPITVEFAKIDSSTNQLISGATLKLSRVDGNMDPITWVTTDQKKVITKLKKGKYILEEVNAPSGYVNTGNAVTFEVKETGEKQFVSMNDAYLTAFVSNRKISIDTNGVSGFKFKLVNENGDKVDEWVSENTAYTTNELAVGKYLLYEESVPSGYVLQSEPYEIMVTSNDSVDTIRMVNNPITVSISKEDFTNGKEVAGAELVLKDSTGKTIDTWVSKAERHLITKLPAGKYTLTETIAPDGYVLSKESVDFEVKETGDIQTAVMYNEPKVDVPNTSQGVNKVLYIISALLLLVGSGVTASVFLKKN